MVIFQNESVKTGKKATISRQSLCAGSRSPKMPFIRLLVAIFVYCVFNPWRACTARVILLDLSFRPSVRPSVCQSVTFSAAMRNRTAKKRYTGFSATLTVADKCHPSNFHFVFPFSKFTSHFPFCTSTSQILFILRFHSPLSQPSR